MQLRRVEIIKYKNFENIVIDFEKSDFPNVFSIASKNGGGKSTLLQFIFIMLHCFSDDNKKKYIQNLLEDINYLSNSQTDLAKFQIIENNIDYYFDFSIVEAEDRNRNFNLYLDEEDLQKEIKKNDIRRKKYEELISIKDTLLSTKRVSPLIKRKISQIRMEYRRESEELEDLSRIIMRPNTSTDDYLNFINLILSDVIEFNIADFNELKDVYEDVKISLNSLEEDLKSKNYRYITHINNGDNVLLLKTNMNIELFDKLSNKVFLTAPSTQIFNFLDSNDKLKIFNSLSENTNMDEPYSQVIEELKYDINNFYTYDFFSIEVIIKAVNKAFEDDSDQKLVNGNYGTNFDDLIKELNFLLENKNIIVEKKNKKRNIIFKSRDGRNLSPTELSHGELKKLGIFIWLKYLVEENSIVLMDEIDIALHPKWQYDLIKDLTCWSKDSQFLLATHSPQILSSTYYKNIIKLDNGKVKRFNKPPVDRDINTIITQIMEADDFPVELLILHKEYRKLINEGKLTTKEAKKLKEKILEYESENSSFFQEINFDLELM